MQADAVAAGVRPRLGVCHRIWFVSTFVAYLGFWILMPPFQTNDEPSHWERAWSVATGHLTCKNIPQSAMDLLGPVNYGGVRDGQAYRFGNIDKARMLTGHFKMVQSGGNACVYIPVAYVLPALSMLPFVNVFDPRDPSEMLVAYYAARLTNLLLMSAAVLLFLWLAPPLRNLTLLLYALPMTMQQATAINQESTIFLFGFSLLLLWWARSSLRQVLGMFVFVTLLAMMKSIYLVLLLWVACAMWRLHKDDPRRWTRWRMAAIASLALIPVIIQALWTKLVVSVSTKEFVPGWGVSPSEQVAYLKAHKGHIFVVLWHQFLDLFGRGHMNGGWISVYGVLGWADFEIGDSAYRWLLFATVLAVFADVRGLDGAPEFGGRRLGGRQSLFIERILPIVSVLALVPAVTMAMYIVFSQVGSPYASGVQGRYLQLPYFATLALAIMWVRSSGRVRAALARLGRWDQRLVPWAIMICSWIGTRAAFRAVIEKYYAGH